MSLVDHARYHQEWRGEGADETDALAALWTMMHGDAPREALSYAAAAITRRTGAHGHQPDDTFVAWAGPGETVGVD